LRPDLQGSKTGMGQALPIIFGRFDLRLADNAIVPVFHALNPVLRFMRCRRELLYDKIGVAVWSQGTCWNNVMTDLELVDHGCLFGWNDQPPAS
jgi:hypothetical protein